MCMAAQSKGLTDIFMKFSNNEIDTIAISDWYKYVHVYFNEKFFPKL